MSKKIITAYNTRRMQQNNFYILRVQTTQAQKSLLFSGTKIWNRIPKYIKMKISKFRKLKNLLHKYK